MSWLGPRLLKQMNCRNDVLIMIALQTESLVRYHKQDPLMRGIAAFVVDARVL